MHHFFIPTRNKLLSGKPEEWKEETVAKILDGILNPADLWRALLGSPQVHWKDGRSAKELAYLWEEERFPVDVQRVIDDFNTNNPEITCFKNMEILYAFPEFQIPLPGGDTSSQADIYLIAKGNKGLLSIAVEGKAGEGFSNQTVEQWLHDKKNSPNSNKPERLKYLADIFGLGYDGLKNIKYQLLHRTANPIIEGSRLGVKSALMLVHSFKEYAHFEDYRLFAETLGFTAPVMHNAIAGPVKVRFEGEEIDLYLGWVCSEIRETKELKEEKQITERESGTMVARLDRSDFIDIIKSQGKGGCEFWNEVSKDDSDIILFRSILEYLIKKQSEKFQYFLLEDTVGITLKRKSKTLGNEEIIASFIPTSRYYRRHKSLFYNRYLLTRWDWIISYFNSNGIWQKIQGPDKYGYYRLVFNNADVYEIDDNGNITENHIINILEEIL